MKAIVIHGFTDKKANKRRKKGETFEITDKRLKEINNAGFGELVKEVKENVNERDKK